MSAQKVREVVRQIQGMNALQAQAVLAVVPRKSARLVAKTLKSALANAENNNRLEVENLFVNTGTVDQGPTTKGWIPRARGRASAIHKKTSHITIMRNVVVSVVAANSRSGLCLGVFR